MADCFSSREKCIIRALIIFNIREEATSMYKCLVGNLKERDLRIRTGHTLLRL
jgi:hypothetical protein